MSYTTNNSSSSYNHAFQGRMRKEDKETPPAFPGAFQSRQQEPRDTRNPYPGAFQTRQQGQQEQHQQQETRENSTNYPSAFQQKKRDYDPRRSQGEYGSWKRKDPLSTKPKELNLSSTDDFPSLGNTTIVSKKECVTDATGNSLAEKLKVVIQQEQEAATLRRYQKDTERSNDIMIPLPFASHWQKKQREKKDALEMKRQEIEEEEEHYRKQMNPDIMVDTLEDEPEYKEEDYNQVEEDESSYKA